MILLTIALVGPFVILAFACLALMALAPFTDDEWVRE